MKKHKIPILKISTARVLPIIQSYRITIFNEKLVEFVTKTYKSICLNKVFQNVKLLVIATKFLFFEKKE